MDKQAKLNDRTKARNAGSSSNQPLGNARQDEGRGGRQTLTGKGHEDSSRDAQAVEPPESVSAAHPLLQVLPFCDSHLGLGLGGVGFSR